MDGDDDDDFNLQRVSEFLGAVKNAAIEHNTEDEHIDQGYSIGILDHINEYKNVK